MARKRHYEFYDPNIKVTKVLTPKQANRLLEGRFIKQVSNLGIGEHIWLYTGERVKCVQ